MFKPEVDEQGKKVVNEQRKVKKEKKKIRKEREENLTSRYR